MSNIYTYPANYRYGRQTRRVDIDSGAITRAPEVSDNNWDTLVSGNRFLFEVHGDTTADNTRLTHIFLRGGDIENYSVTIPSGQGTGTASIINKSPQQNIDGVQYDLRTLNDDGDFQVRQVQIDLTGAGAYLHEVMLMESLIFLENPYNQFEPSVVDRFQVIRPNIRDNFKKISGFAQPKWTTNYTARFIPGRLDGGEQVTGDYFSRLMLRNPNFVMEDDFNRWPDRVYPAAISGGISINFIGDIPTQQDLSFTVVQL